jgi:hypothetical protein
MSHVSRRVFFYKAFFFPLLFIGSYLRCASRSTSLPTQLNIPPTPQKPPTHPTIS